ncbi:MAG: hypothetical protein WAJ85_13265, partial [Candidatus Baltobacteraceae bacterium]
ILAKSPLLRSSLPPSMAPLLVVSPRGTPALARLRYVTAELLLPGHIVTLSLSKGAGARDC